MNYERGNVQFEAQCINKNIQPHFLVQFSRLKRGKCGLFKAEPINNSTALCNHKILI